MELKKIDRSFAVSPQISPADVVEIAEAGYRTIICNRPDGEGNDQPLFHEIEEAARQAGLQVHYLPVVSGQVSDADADAFGEVFEAAPKPVFGYCRSGTRSVTLWALSRAGRMPLADILAAARTAGYDMSGVVRRIANQGRTPGAVGGGTLETVN